MIERALTALALLALASCPRAAMQSPDPDAPDLETAAIERGLVIDPRDREIAGLYARETDRLCLVRRGGSYRVGVSTDLGDDIACSAAGTVERSGDRLQVTLGQGCGFAARLDGERITFPARLPDACARACTRRATLAALSVTRLSESQAEASTMRDAGGHQPCG